MFERKSLEIGGAPCAYWVGGEGPPLVYLHAAGGAMRTPFLQMLAEHRTVYMPIAPGFDGEPARAGVDSIATLADLAAAFVVAAVGDAPVEVMGASFGGWIALWLALRHPSRVRQLVLEAPAGLRAGDPPQLSPEQMRAALYAYPDKAAALAPAPEIARANGQAYAAYARGVDFDAELAAALPSLAAHTLVLMATRDAITPAQTGHLLAGALPQGRLAYIHDAAHALEVDQPGATLRTVLPFLERGPAFIVAARPAA